MADKKVYVVRLTYQAEVEATNLEFAIGSARNRVERYQFPEDGGPKAEIVESSTKLLIIEGVDIGQGG